jgi:hypothetical protein
MSHCAHDTKQGARPVSTLQRLLDLCDRAASAPDWLELGFG